MAFEIYRSKQNEAHFVAIHITGDDANAEAIRRSENLEFFVQIPDDGLPRLGFEPAKARAAIREQGFYAFAVHIEPREHHDLQD